MKTVIALLLGVLAFTQVLSGLGIQSRDWLPRSITRSIDNMAFDKAMYEYKHANDNDEWSVAARKRHLEWKAEHPNWPYDNNH